MQKKHFNVKKTFQPFMWSPLNRLICHLCIEWCLGPT